MRGSVRAAAIALASALVSSAHPIVTDDGLLASNELPHAFIDLDVARVIEDVFIPRTLLAFDVFESDASCNHGNITLDGSKLAEDANGVGAGPITTRHGTVVNAEWQFTCVQVDDRQNFEQVLQFNILDIDGYNVQNLNFTIQFQQMAPTGVTRVDGAFSIIRVPTATSRLLDSNVPRRKPYTLQSELYELEVMKATLAKVEFEIAAKEWFIGQQFPETKSTSTSSISDCKDLKCFVTTLGDRFRGLFSGLQNKQKWFDAVMPEVADTDASNRGSNTTTSTSLSTNTEAFSTVHFPHVNAPGSQSQNPFGLPSVTAAKAGNESSTETVFPKQEMWRPSVDIFTAHPKTSLGIIGSALLVLVVVIFATHAACTEKARKRRCARRLRRQQCREKRQARCQAIKNAYAKIRAWLKGRASQKPSPGDEEKIAAAAAEDDAPQDYEQRPITFHPRLSLNIPTATHSLSEISTTPFVPEPIATQQQRRQQQRREPESDEESTTMEQDIAHFRAVAGFVENLFSAGGGGGPSGDGERNTNSRPPWTRPRRPRRHSSPQRYSGPPSPTSTVPDYTSSDEALPSYEESSADSSVSWV